MAVDALQRSPVADDLGRLVAIAADVYGIPPRWLGSSAGARGNGRDIAVRLEARYAVIGIATKRQIGTRQDVLDAMSLSEKRHRAISVAEQRFARRMVEDRDVANRIARIERRFDGLPDRVVLATGDGYGPRNVSASRLRELYKRGWTTRRLSEQWDVPEYEIEQIVRRGKP